MAFLARSLFGYGTSAEVVITLDDEDHRRQVQFRPSKDRLERAPLYADNETVSGRVQVQLSGGSSAHLEHYGVKVEFVGCIEMYGDKSNVHEFVALSQELAAPGELGSSASFGFDFPAISKPFETYHGINVKLRYFVRATVAQRLSDIIKEKDIWVYHLAQWNQMQQTVKMEIGIEDCLHIELELNKSAFSLKDVIIGKIYFLLVRINIKHMELSIIRRESTGSSPNIVTENETVTRYEIMDGCAMRGDHVPIRLWLSGYDLTPTFVDVNKRFSTRYMLNVVILDHEGRRYFRASEITLYRTPDDIATDTTQSSPVADTTTSATTTSASAAAAVSANTPSIAPSSPAKSTKSGAGHSKRHRKRDNQQTEQSQQQQQPPPPASPTTTLAPSIIDEPSSPN
ncbi:Vps26-domain-containing protein [Ramicandelaber brevisporus]|nr:Vps26-domain-containing protein [Ramicandelaber brevisporus]